MPNRLERFLDAAEKPLSRLGTEERSAWREEARGHLIDSMAEKEATGLSREAAVETALAEFGEARRIRQAVARVKDPPADRLVRALFGGLLGLLGIGVPLWTLGAGNALSFLPNALIAQFFWDAWGWAPR